MIVCQFSVNVSLAEPGYIPPPRSSYADSRITDSPKAAKAVADKIDKLYRSEEFQRSIDYARDIGEQLRPGGAISHRVLMGHHNIARENELDENDGHHPTSRAWDEYTQDSKYLLKDPTFVPCIEWREVVDNDDYLAACAFNCPACVDPENYVGGWDPPINPLNCECLPTSTKCIQQKRMVIEFYWPKYTFAVNKAGARSLDPTMFDPQQNREEWLRSELARKHRNEVEPEALQRIEEKGIPTDSWEDPDWRSGEFEYQMHLGSFAGFLEGQKFVRAYRTNLDFRATDDKPRQRWWHGWAQNPKSLLWALGEGTLERKIQTHTMEEGDLFLISMFPELQENLMITHQGDFEAAINMGPQYVPEKDNKAPFEELGPSYRAFRDRDDFRVHTEARRTLDVEPNLGHPNQRDITWVRQGGGGADGYLHVIDHMFNDELKADAARSAKIAVLLGFNQKLPASHNRPDFRHYIFSLHENRESKKGYVGPWDSLDDGPFQRITHTDKMQRVFPPVEGNDDRGTYCFRPENIPNFETNKDDSEWIAFNARVEHYGETRFVGWNKMVGCFCEHCGKWRGSILLNDGDYRENTFEGKTPYHSPPDPFAAAMPFLRQYADERTPPQSFPPICDDFNRCVLPLEGMDKGEPGVIEGSGQTLYIPPPEISCPVALGPIPMLKSGGFGLPSPIPAPKSSSHKITPAAWSSKASPNREDEAHRPGRKHDWGAPKATSGEDRTRRMRANGVHAPAPGPDKPLGNLFDRD